LKIEELFNKIIKALDELKSLNAEIPIIVEGESDTKALRELGIKGEIIQINIGQRIFNFCEEISRKYPMVVILTDWDRKGGQLCKQLKEGFKANDVKYNIDIRARLAGYCKKETKDVEGLPGCIYRLSGEIKNIERKPMKR
jgi:5S rRNA maturation endonuclease (ribonuclease M5)